MDGIGFHREENLCLFTWNILCVSLEPYHHLIEFERMNMGLAAMFRTSWACLSEWHRIYYWFVREDGMYPNLAYTVRGIHFLLGPYLHMTPFQPYADL